MQSDAADFCSWCKKDLRNVPNSGGRPVQVTTTKPNQGKRPTPPKPSKSGPLPSPAPPPKPSGYKPVGAGGAGVAAVQAGPVAAPQLGTFQAAKSKYYSDKVQDPISGAIYDADTGKAEEKLAVDKIIIEETNDLKQLGINIVVLLVISAIAAGIGSALPTGYIAIMGITCFIAGIIMPILRSVPFMADDAADIALALGLMLILGPFVGFIAYVVLAVVRGGDFNPAMIGVFASSVIVRLAIDLGSGKPLGDFVTNIIPQLTFENYAVRSMPIITLIGWMCGDIFKKHDE